MKNVEKVRDNMRLEKKKGTAEVILTDNGVDYIYYIMNAGPYEHKGQYDYSDESSIYKLALSQKPLSTAITRAAVISTDKEGAVLIDFNKRRFLCRPYIAGDEYTTAGDDTLKIIEFIAEEL